MFNMNSTEILSNFGLTSTCDKVVSLFSMLNTLNRPQLPEDEEYIYHDWVLVRRKGLELGFTDSEYQTAAARFRWGHGELLLTQAYFYSGFNDIQPFTGELPFSLKFSDSKDAARVKLIAFDASRHSYINDTWDVDGYRLSLTYENGGQSIDRIACRVLAAPIPSIDNLIYPSLANISAVFGDSIRSAEFAALWGDLLDDEKLLEAIDDGEIDFTQSYGATIGLAGDGKSTSVFRSITLHRNRDSESAGWGGELPLGLQFNDSPEVLFTKITEPPIQHADSALTGHAVWHFIDYTLHVLYSNLDNRLLRIKLIAPGSWKCIDEE
jgi:hypothetical protein